MIRKVKCAVAFLLMALLILCNSQEVIIEVNPTNVLSFQDNVTLTCSTSGVITMLQWTKDGVDLPGETLSTLELNQVSATDGGEYTCSITNEEGSDSATVSLNG